MALEKLTYRPEQRGYRLSRGNEIISIELEGGLPRKRRGIVDAAHILSLSWALDQSEYTAFMTFYNTNLNRGADFFLMDLIVDSGSALTEHEVCFVPDTLQLSSVEGHLHRVTAQVYIKPIATNLTISPGLSQHVPAGDGQYMIWEFDQSADAASSTTDFEGAFYPLIGSSDWARGTIDTSDSTEWTFPNGEWEWVKTGNKGLKCISNAKSGFRMRFDASASDLRTQLFPGIASEPNPFYGMEFYVEGLDLGGPSGTEGAILFSAPFDNASATKIVFGIDPSGNLELQWHDGSDNQTVVAASALTLPFTGQIGFAIHPTTARIKIFVNGVETDDVALDNNYDGFQFTSFANRGALGIGANGAADEEPPNQCVYRVWTLYKIPITDLINDWEINIFQNNYNYYAPILGYV